MPTAQPTRLKAATLAAFDAYIHNAEIGMERTLSPGGAFLWSDQESQRQQQIHRGEILAQFWSGRNPVKAPEGLIHDWIAAAFLPDATLADTLALIQDYDHHKVIYKPEVMDSKLIRRQ